MQDNSHESHMTCIHLHKHTDNIKIPSYAHLPARQLGKLYSIVNFTSVLDDFAEIGVITFGEIGKLLDR